MSAHVLARQFFAPPGADSAHTRHLLAQAAGSHARLLDTASATQQVRLDRLRETLGAYLRSSAPSTEKRFVLDDPHFIEALHALSSASSDLSDWDATVAPGCYHAPVHYQAQLARGCLGNVVVALLLRRSRNWCGQIELATDAYGRVHLPFSDWALVLVNESSEGRQLFARQSLVLHLDQHAARWMLPGAEFQLLARMPRSVFEAMFIDNRTDTQAREVEFPDGPLFSRFDRATRLGQTRIRFEPIADDLAPEHADLTGAIVAALVSAIEQNAPAIHDQLAQCIRTIHGFELPDYACGRIDSFSAPTSPGVIGFNVQYTLDDEPRLSPYCFLWLGHELGHTLHYLIDDVAYTHGWRFLENPGEMTPTIARYGRSVTVRTLSQIPYVHLYEWWLLMLFLERGFGGLPWRMPNDWIDVGNDLRDEIDEAFDLIHAHARLTATGQAVFNRLRELAGEANSHWRRLATMPSRGRAIHN